jgi:hypothetical protein
MDMRLYFAENGPSVEKSCTNCEFTGDGGFGMAQGQ